MPAAIVFSLLRRRSGGILDDLALKGGGLELFRGGYAKCIVSSWSVSSKGGTRWFALERVVAMDRRRKPLTQNLGNDDRFGQVSSAVEHETRC